LKTKELYNELVFAYRDENLNQITGKLIVLYKQKNYPKIREIANKVSNYFPIDEENDAKCFSKLIMLYHPDKGDQIRKSIEEHYGKNDYENLKKHAHILILDNIEVSGDYTINEDVDYNPEYAWDVEKYDGYEYEEDEENSHEEDYERSFYNLIKIREYGNVHIEFPTYYLEDFEEFEIAYSGLETLDGVEYCTHVKILDVSNNLISDIENLWSLEHLEELYLANNQIGYIDTLSNLTNLKILDLSGNQIDDISPLLSLEQLEYVNLIGNNVGNEHIDFLRAKDVVVMAD
jgi:Leucine-rich repeat (LRR) protein